MTKTKTIKKFIASPFLFLGWALLFLSVIFIFLGALISGVSVNLTINRIDVFLVGGFDGLKAFEDKRVRKDGE